jgi:pimeloyl-ACP methyl ester carboxylesterase
MSEIDRFKSAQHAVLTRYGVDAESTFLEIDAVKGKTHVLTAGDGPPLVFVPGFADPAAMWVPLMAELEGFRMYAVDRPCFGLTGSATLEADSIRRLAVDFLEQALDALQLDSPLFIGNSIGSQWTFWLAIDRPNRVSAMTHAGCPATILGTAAPLPMRLMSVEPVGKMLMGMAEPSPDQVKKFAAMAKVDLSQAPEIVDLLVAAQNLPNAGTAIRNVLRATVGLFGPRPEVILGPEELEMVGQPVQFIWGEHDPFGDITIGKSAAKIVLRSEFHLVPGVGHLPWFPNPDVVSRIAKPFLEKHAA